MKRLIFIAMVVLLSSSIAFAQGDPCTADFDCNGTVDADDVATFLSMFGRNPFYNPCPDCYDSQCPCTICPYGMVDCLGTCVDPLKDREYCGATEGCLDGIVCLDGEICDGGMCTFSCQSGLTNCSGMCVDTETNEGHCGGCDDPCGSGEVCIVGSCEIYCSDNYTPVEKTGQTTSYATGDDGDLERGVAWPNPRFTDNGNGTVTDNLTELIWLKDANCFGTRTWNNAQSDSNGLADGSCGLTDGSQAGDWRLSNKKELLSLTSEGYYNPAVPDTVGTGKCTEGDPFNNVQYGGISYWTSTTNAVNSDLVRIVVMSNGNQGGSAGKTSLHYLWPVRGGH